MTDPTPREPTPAQALLGLFVAFQLLFLLIANVLWPLREVLPATQAIRGATTDVWAGLTLQMQQWSMFSEFPRQSAFAATRLVWHAPDGSLPLKIVTVPSFEEPADPEHFLAPNVFADRLHNYDAWQMLVCEHRDRVLRDHPTRQHEVLTDWASVWWRPLRASLRWRLERYLQAHPGSPPPDEVILLVRSYEPPAPGATPWRLHGPVDRELVRWRPAAVVPDGECPLAVYHPEQRTYVTLRVRP